MGAGADTATVASELRSGPLRVIVIGLGAIGGAAADACIADDAFDVLGAVDPLRAGERLGFLTVEESAAAVGAGAEVALLCTSSTLAAVEKDVTALVTSGLDVVSTCEELTLPWFTNAEIADRIDGAARAGNRTVLGCGVNPGFTMDVLPLLVASASLRPQCVNVTRRVNLERRRPQLRAKLGVGHTPEEWQARQAHGRNVFGHFGLVESARLLALGLGWEVAGIEFTREPLTRDGSVIGVEEVAQLACKGGRKVELTLRFALGGEDVDAVVVDGEPSIELVAPSGVHGDTATVARLLHAARVVQQMSPGLRLPIEAPLWAP